MLIKPTPWDTKVFGIPTWEITEYSEEAFKETVKSVGHYTIKVDPLSNKKLLHEYGFYYCDTLITPVCNINKLRMYQLPEASISKIFDSDDVLRICSNAFSHGRFHRDFNLSESTADLRYENWLKQLLDSQTVYGLFWAGSLAGFIGYKENNLVLHAISKDYQGKGLSKFWWSAVCKEILAMGYQEVRSSISATNLAVLNLYISLGFSFQNPKDIYHKMVP